MTPRYLIPALLLATALVVVPTIASPDENELEKALRAVGYTSVTLRKTVTDQFEVNATLNGNKPITLLLSFQADNTLFDTRRLRESGIEFDKSGQEYRVNDDASTLFLIRTDSINIGSGKVGPEEIMCIDYGEFEYFEDYRVTGILGRDFLIKNNAIIDFANQKLYIKGK